MSDSRGFRSGKAGILPLLAAAFLLSACARGSYMGVPLAIGMTNPQVQNLARRARAGDKVAQLELGILLEEGISLPRNLKAAEHLYQKASQSSGGARWLYVPGSQGEKGRVASFDTAQTQPGIPEARLRLEDLQRRRGF